jgi:hypothetical protein
MTPFPAAALKQDFNFAPTSCGELTPKRDNIENIKITDISYLK